MSTAEHGTIVRDIVETLLSVSPIAEELTAVGLDPRVTFTRIYTGTPESLLPEHLRIVRALAAAWREIEPLRVEAARLAALGPGRTDALLPRLAELVAEVRGLEAERDLLLEYEGATDAGEIQ